MTLWASGRGHHSFCPSPVLQAFFATEGSQMSESGLCWVPDGDESPSKIGRPQQGRATWAPWSQVPVRGGGMEGEHLGPPQGSETSLQAFQGTCVLFFFSFHYHSHSGESKHEQTKPTTTRQGVDGEGKATSMYMFSCSSGTDSTAPSWDGEEPFPRGVYPLRGCGGLVICTWGRAAAGPSGGLAVRS